jgi:hypothetical protein
VPLNCRDMSPAPPNPDDILDEMRPEDADAQVGKIAGNGSPAEKYVRRHVNSCDIAFMPDNCRRRLNGCGCLIGTQILSRPL